MKKMQLTITHLYPEKMNLYGDMGNIITLKQRAKARGIMVRIRNVTIGTQIRPNETDIYFFGGGQDSQQIEIAPDLVNKKKKIILEDLDDNVVALAICGGYQLLGKYYLAGKGEKAEGLGFFPIETVAPGPDVKQRCIGNINANLLHEQTLDEIKKYYNFEKISETKKNSIVGFENHSGRTRLLSEKNLHLAEVTKGIGDSEDQGFEGLRYKNAFGTYMHGSFLPKNPHIADLLLSLALKRKYKANFQSLVPLDDSLEWQAHEAALKLK